MTNDLLPDDMLDIVKAFFNIHPDETFDKVFGGHYHSASTALGLSACKQLIQHVRKSTPNKPAEVDLDALKVEVGQNVISDQFTVNRVIDYLAASGHLATGKGGGDVDISKGIAEQLSEGSGFWRTCSGCHETEDGHDVGYYPHSKTFNCQLGMGCSECGGIGAIWDDTDYEDMAKFMMELDRSEQPAAPTQIDAGDTPQPSPQSDMVAVPREVITLAEMAIRDARTMVKLSVSPKNGIMQGGINNLEKAFTALQPYTKETK